MIRVGYIVVSEYNSRFYDNDMDLDILGKYLKYSMLPKLLGSRK